MFVLAQFKGADLNVFILSKSLCTAPNLFLIWRWPIVPESIFKGMQLTFLGNTYTKSFAPQVKPDVQLRYQGKVYQARRLEAANALASNAIVLTYRGVSYTK